METLLTTEERVKWLFRIKIVGWGVVVTAALTWVASLLWSLGEGYDHRVPVARPQVATCENCGRPNDELPGCGNARPTHRVGWSDQPG